MQFVDTRIVNRSNALQGFRYGRNLIYSERMGGPGLFSVVVSSFLMSVVGSLLCFSFTRNLIKRFLPAPGQGPSKEVMDKGYFHMKFWGRGTKPDGSEAIVRGGIQAPNGDPGYKQTSMLVAESAVCLAQGGQNLPQTFGVLTPSVAMGATLRERLQEKGINFIVENSEF